MPNLKAFFSRTFRPFYLLTGAGTALIGVFAFFPSWATPTIARLPSLVDYTIIIQHWGIMVGLMGLFMMGAAIVPEWCVPIALYSLVEKAHCAVSRTDESDTTLRFSVGLSGLQTLNRSG